VSNPELGESPHLNTKKRGAVKGNKRKTGMGKALPHKQLQRGTAPAIGEKMPGWDHEEEGENELAGKKKTYMKSGVSVSRHRLSFVRSQRSE